MRYLKTLYLLPLIFFLCNTKVSAEYSKKVVLIVHSYHQGYEWSDGIHNGLINTLKNFKNLEVYVEYLDLVRNKETDEYTKLWINFLKEKYKDKKIDLLISVDDNAFEFFIKHRSTIFGNIPMVFCGVNDFTKEMLKNNKNITGVNEQKSMAETIELALRLSKDAKKLGVIAGDRISERKNLEQFKRDVKPFEKKTEIIYFNQREFDEILKGLENFDEKDVVIYLSYLRSPSGKIFDNTENLKRISQKTSARVFTVSDHMVKADVIGGKVTYAYSQGESAGKMAIDILINGKKADEIPILYKSPNRFVFNGGALIKHNISIATLPKDSVIINKTDQYMTDQWKEEIKKSFFGYDLFRNHGTVMLIIDPRTGTIIDANETAKLYYGYPRLIGKKIQEINTLSEEEVKKEMAKAKELKRNYFSFRHRLASGDIRDVEVYSYPIKLGEDSFLFSIVFDVTEKLLAEKENEKEKKRVLQVLISLLVISVAFLLILALYIINRKRYEKDLTEKNKRLEEAHRQIKTLEGILPICMHCKKIRDDKGYWNQLEKYISQHTTALLSHGLCPDCAKKHYGDYLKKNE
ncbi:MAG: PAS domain S-box protein [Proteobacteria bacterium]|nr:PAS domain S-box protein [Pseudomonadota bacterium]